MSVAGADLDRVYRYVGRSREGKPLAATVRAVDERAALRQLTIQGVFVTQLKEAAAPRQAGKRRPLKPGERVLIMRQLALMLEAGVPLLEAVQSVAAGLESLVARTQFAGVMTALKSGEPFGTALRTHAPGFPFYLYAMVEMGEASGKVAEVLRAGAEQMAFEERLRREFLNAMTYPAFLGAAGVAAVTFIFVEVVPRFSTMIGENTEGVPLMARVVLAAGNFANRNSAGLMIALVLLGFAVATAAASPAVRSWLYGVAHRLPVVSGLLKAREITTWARLTAFSLTSGVPILVATSLARQATPKGDFRRGLESFEQELRVGLAIDEALARHTALGPMDLSLLRTGQRSGALPRMFNFLADSYEAKLTDQIKRMTALVEPIAIGLISIVIGVVALSLVLALSSVYDRAL